MSGRRRSATDLAGLFAQPGTRPDRNEDPGAAADAVASPGARPDPAAPADPATRTDPRTDARAYTRADPYTQGPAYPPAAPDPHMYLEADAFRRVERDARSYAAAIRRAGQRRQALREALGLARGAGIEEERLRALLLVIGLGPESAE